MMNYPLHILCQKRGGNKTKTTSNITSKNIYTTRDQLHMAVTSDETGGLKM